MKMIYGLCFTLLIFMGELGCVQKAYKKTVVYRLSVDSSISIKSVGIRGEDRPLSWEKDVSLKSLKNGSVYQAIVDYRTGYKFTEVKFTINGDFELKDEKNRRIIFSPKDTTYYQAEFNKVK